MKQNRTEKKPFFFLFVFCAALLVFLLTASCVKVHEESDTRNSDAAPVYEEANRSRRALLIRGNSVAPGIPGFAANSFPALSGEYAFEGLSAGEKDAGFSVFLTRVPLFFSGEWRERASLSDIGIVQREEAPDGEGSGFFAAAPLEDRQGTDWTLVFHFPLGLEKTGLAGDDFNRLVRAWINRFSYYLSNSKSEGEISLPAFAEF